MVAYVFPGQGSQEKGMGAGLFGQFKDLTAQADSILGYSIEELCMEDPEERLRKSQFTQPALYVVNALTYMKRLYDTGIMPDQLAGHSLGEYNALLAAGVFDFSTGLRLVQKRGELMGRVIGGGMAAVIGLSADKVEKVLQSTRVEGVSVANYNTPTQIVISGARTTIDKLESAFSEAGAGYMVLNVSGAFHSQWMAEAQSEFSEFVAAFDFRAPAMPVISNLHAKPYTADSVKDNLVRQISSPVRWTETVQYLLSTVETEIVEVGPGKVLTGMVDKIKRAAG